LIFNFLFTHDIIMRVYM